MKAIILAAGQGTRLKKYTENLPKGMLVFNGKTLIERQIDLYHACGIEDISIVRGYAADRINYSGIKYYDNVNFASTNMVESLLAAKNEFNDDTIVSYSDIVFEEEMLRKLMATKHDFSVAVDDSWEKYWMKRYGRTDFDTESLKIGEDDNITGLGKENPPLSEIDARYIGLLMFSRRGLETILSVMDAAHKEYDDKPSWQQSGKPVRKAYMTDLLNALIEAGMPVNAVHFNSGWLEFDTNEDYENAMKWISDGSIKQLINFNW